MSGSVQPCDLTPELIAAAFPDSVPDDEQAMALASDAEVMASLDATMADHAHGAGLWVFGYGSLMWRPELVIETRLLGTLSGWQRSFCLWQWRYRGTRERPGLMLALDEGGACTGYLYHLRPEGLRDQLIPLWKREITGRGYVPGWVDVASSEGPVRAVTFLAKRDGPRYAGRLEPAVIADHIASACGVSGPSAAYLFETWRACRGAGIADSHVETLQRLVAERLVKRCNANESSSRTR